jgi:hypothetical protein
MDLCKTSEEQIEPKLEGIYEFFDSLTMTKL